jgi:membrane protein YdbS with pleckstrin-like domain
MYRVTTENLRHELGTSPLAAVAFDVGVVAAGVVAYFMHAPTWVSAPLVAIGVLGVAIKLLQWGRR